ncbi:hypothetical protein JJJ17_02615 [Paracoccus caeni]|uniref:Uncharacterized protein n=1 Tax=Paracoccus caeni TaxID=657651 RepID=A0A934SI05_9RHOB|nr:hypothetical protein [Paracoccus caeni]MBK4214813.1 hypothetical protein [Paracoccus caeni]
MTSYSIPEDFAVEPWRNVSGADLRRTDTVPTMLHRQEQKLYYWLTRNTVGGEGAVVDLGAFAGGSTARLAQGLADAGSATVIHAYDRFTVDPRTKKNCLYAHGVAPFEGNDLLPLAKSLLAPWSDRIRLHVGEIQDIGWDAENGAIALLMLDACKRTEWTDSTAATFYPHLIAGQSIINHQDFLQWDQFWLPPHMLLMADYFQPLAFVRNTSLMFRCVRVPTVQELTGLTVADLDDNQMIEAIRDMKRRFKGWGMGARFERMITAIQLNPGERRHWQMKKPPPLKTD